MKQIYLSILFSFIYLSVWANVAIKPTINPSIFKYNDEITVTYDVTGTPLANLNAAYIWVWIPGANTNAKYNINPANSNTSLTDNAKFTKSVNDNKTLFTITFKPSDFFSGNISAAEKIGMLLKGNDWSNGQTTDHIVDFCDGSFQVRLLSPIQQPLFASQGEEILIEAETPVNVKFELFINDISVDVKNNLSKYEYTHSVTESEGQSTIRIKATEGTNVSEVEFTYTITTPSVEAKRPAGIIAGINYHEDPTKVTLCLWAPGKSSVHVYGDFNNWNVSPEFQMNKDDEFFWLEIDGLTSGQEYAYQYLVDQFIRIADPYADKILDPDDVYIPTTSYPNLKPFPQQALTNRWYFNRVAVFQTGQIPYQWKVTDFQKPPQGELVIYELLIRDFFGANGRNYKNLIDTIGYFKRLGINAIKLMPVMEFNGNESWGYNPTFKFAPDKYYGPKNDLKAFIDKCHEHGIAVILDIVMNHHDMPAPYVMMDFDFEAGQPTPDNKWFNVTAKHPYNVFFDMNHESQYTKTYLDTVNHYWLNEYKVDGFRYDLSKGFTQVNSGDDVGKWSARDNSRIALLKRMADKIWSHSPDAYVILEHFADNSEEKELAEYRANEGKGMMLWGNLNHAYSQNTKGVSSGSNIDWVYHKTRNWSVPHVIGYMESHDEERLMYRNLTEGESSGSYNVRNVNTALNRMKTAGVMFYLVPGPKMIWQFGEMGFDFSINRCEDGSINNNCRLSIKPVGWGLLNDPVRKQLFDHNVDLLQLRQKFEVFRNGTAEFIGGNNLVKQVNLTSKSFTANPTTPAEMSAKMVANFGVTQTTVNISFPHTGTWYDYYNSGTPVTLSGSNHSLTLNPGEYRLFTDYRIQTITSTRPEIKNDLKVYPNPTNRFVTLPTELGRIEKAVLYTVAGNRVRSFTEPEQLDMEGLPAGVYVAEIVASGSKYRYKIIKK
jgi:1,4-alpha-glucan branching enzyme